MKHLKHNNPLALLYAVIIGITIVSPTSSFSAETADFSITIPPNIELDISKYAANGPDLFLFIYPTSGRGIEDHHDYMAQKLADADIEVWLADIIDALFLPHSSSTKRKLTGEYLAELIKIAHFKTSKNIYIAGNSYAAIPILRGAYLWQNNNPGKSYLKSAILFTPKLYKTLPPLGQNPQYLPIVSATNIPLIIFQGSKHGNKWQLPFLLNELGLNNTKIYVELVPKVGSLFATKEVTENQKTFFKSLPSKLRYISKMRPKSTPIPIAKDISFDTVTQTGVDNRLKKYAGQAKPLAIKLLDFSGKQFELHDYKNKVTIVNFWATWCIPCVKEIPSLNRLKAVMKNRPFELISINFQEKPDAIREFQKMVKVKFPVLMDSDGEIAKQWKVIAFPSTFLIGPDGKIHYGVNAGIEWDTPEVTKLINSLF